MEGGGEEKGVKLEILTTPRRLRRAKVEGSDKQLLLTSWSHLLDSMATAVAGDSTVSSDIQQLRGLARVPIHLRTGVDYQQVLNDVVDQIKRIRNVIAKL